MKFKKLMIIPIAFLLTGCPPGHFYEYEYIGNQLIDKKGKILNFKFIDNKNLKIHCGFLVKFIEDKKRSLIAEIEIDSVNIIDLEKLKINVISSKLGQLKQNKETKNSLFKHSKNSLIFFSDFNNKNENKILEELENDTIKIEVENRKYLFIKK